MKREKRLSCCLSWAGLELEKAFSERSRLESPSREGSDLDDTTEMGSSMTFADSVFFCFSSLTSLIVMKFEALIVRHWHHTCAIVSICLYNEWLINAPLFLETSTFKIWLVPYGSGGKNTYWNIPARRSLILLCLIHTVYRATSRYNTPPLIRWKYVPYLPLSSQVKNLWQYMVIWKIKVQYKKAKSSIISKYRKISSLIVRTHANLLKFQNL